MRMAIISDTHFGDPMCSLVEIGDDQKPAINSKYQAFKEVVGKENDYLVVLGDILDFSIAGYRRAYECAKVFFLQAQRDSIAREMIYIPGNHDFDLWDTVEYEVNIINRIKENKPVRPFKRTVPGIIDDRPESRTEGLVLAGVSEREGADETRYAGLFLDRITEPEGRKTPFNFVYPNLYVVTKRGDPVLVTHGHYFERYWALAGEWALKIAREDLKVGALLSLKETVGINFPLSQLACSGVGQAGPLTRIVRLVQREVKDGNLKRVKKYLDRADNEIDKLTRFPLYKICLEWLTDVVSNNMKKKIVEALEKYEETRFNEDFIHKKEVQGRFMNFYNASMVEIGQLNDRYGYDIPMPRYVIFGHTHRPTPWGHEDAPKTMGAQPVSLFNTGGWLYRQDERGEKEFVGAEVFIYDSEEGFFRSSSVS
jgi:UDP-2,3-diacylglucosamine pyrophosphatase LpxH